MMGIGTSKGAYYEDDYHYHAAQWDDKYDDNVIKPDDTGDDNTKFVGDGLPNPSPMHELQVGDKPDYDMDAWKAATGLDSLPEGQHYPDTFKLPNHMTFSEESKYSGINGAEGGRWQKIEGDPNYDWSFTPGKTNLENHTPEELKDYFNKVEPKSKLILPEQTAKDYISSGKLKITPEEIDNAVNIGMGVGPLATEKIASAALKYGGKIYEGLNHGFALNTILDETKGAATMHDIQDGFTTSHGRFVSREEAYKIADKQKQLANDMPSIPEESRMLLSEDLQHVQDRMFQSKDRSGR